MLNFNKSKETSPKRKYEMKVYLGYELVMVGQMGPAMDTAVSSVALVGQVCLERLNHPAAVRIPHTCSGRVGLAASCLSLLSAPSARHTVAPDDNANCCDLWAQSKEKWYISLEVQCCGPRGV